MKIKDNGMMRSFVKHVHFVGVGGAGMSGLAEVLANLGYRVSGSDMKATEITRRLESMGACVHEGHAASHAEGADVVVYSSAVAPNNPEILHARRRRVPIIPRAQMLAELGRMKKTVTIAGSHGKTTTTSMTAMALKAAGAEPTMIIGGQLKNIRANARLGVGEYLVAEADESDGSFLYLNPVAAIVTNIDNDHLDFHKSMDGLKKAFLAHLERLPFYGAAVLCADDPGLSSIRSRVKGKVITYGLNRDAVWQGANLRLGPRGTQLDVCVRGKKAGRMRLQVCGRHNALNALAALAAGDFLGFDLKKLLRGLAEFSGVGRRMDRLGAAAGIEFIDDYGHHPTEIAATLAAARLMKPRRLLVVFQPHRYSRTKLLAHDFGPAFKPADFVYVMDIYPAGETPMPGVSSKLILDSMRRNAVACAPMGRAADAIKELKAGDLVLTLGAGDVWKVGYDLMRRARQELLSPP